MSATVFKTFYLFVSWFVYPINETNHQSVNFISLMYKDVFFVLFFSFLFIDNSCGKFIAFLLVVCLLLTTDTFSSNIFFIFNITKTSNWYFTHLLPIKPPNAFQKLNILRQKESSIY